MALMRGKNTGMNVLRSEEPLLEQNALVLIQNKGVNSQCLQNSPHIMAWAMLNLFVNRIRDAYKHI